MRGGLYFQTTLKKYLVSAGIELSKSQFVFRNLRFCAGHLVLVEENTHMSYTRVSEIVKSKYAQIGLDKKFYKLHSLRSGGASAAANNQVSDRQLQRHGRWKTEAVKNRYINESLSDLLSVSRNLGI